MAVLTRCAILRSRAHRFSQKNRQLTVKWWVDVNEYTNPREQRRARGAMLQRNPHSSRPLMELPVRVYRKPITGVCPKNTGRANVYDERACASTPPRCVYIAYGCIVAHTRSHAMMQTRVEIISAFAFHRPRRATTSDPPAYRAHELFYEFRHVIKEAALISFRRVTRD